MNQNPLSGGTLPLRLDGVDLFGQALDSLHPESTESQTVSDAGLIHDEGPRLSLVRPEDYEDIPLEDAQDSLDSVYGAPSPSVDVNEMPTLTSDNLPLSESFELDDLPSIDHLLNQECSESECITIANPRGETRQSFVAEEPAELDISPAALESIQVPAAVSAPSAAKSAPSTGLTAPAPQKIGSGRLNSAKLSWKPGDPFGCSNESMRGRFRWEIMLTTACVTALCGLACIWVLRTILA